MHHVPGPMPGLAGMPLLLPQKIKPKADARTQIEKLAANQRETRESISVLNSYFFAKIRGKLFYLRLSAQIRG
jgi:hypothetical protein